MRLLKAFITAAIAAALLIVPAASLAKRGDRDHDRMADRWEKRHHLNTRANDARRDPDKDGLSNLSEFRHHTDPRDADTDDDGIDDDNELRDHTNPRHDDSDELSGTVVSFDNGTLTIQLAVDGAPAVSGAVNDATRIECDDDDDAPAASASDHGSDDGSDNSGPGSGDDDRSGPGDGSTTTSTGGSDDGANHDAGDDHGSDDGADHSCTTADLKPGARVHEAKLAKASDGTTVFTKIELVPAA